MKTLRKLWESLIRPKIWFAILASIISVLMIASTIVLLVLGLTDFWVYIIYVFGALGITYIVYLIVYFAPKIKKGFLDLVNKFEFTHNFVKNFGFRSLIMGAVSFIINICYAGLQIVIAIISHSIWYGSLAVYYLVLSLIRGGVLFKYNRRKNLDNEQEILYSQVKSYRNCGIYITAITLAMNAAIVQMVISTGYSYNGWVMYAVAAYTFYKLTFAIINIFKAKRRDNYTIQTIRNVGLVDAVVSVLALQTALFNAFGQGVNTVIFNAITGGIVTLIILTLGIIMLVRGNKKLKELRNE